ncbi:MAG: substrate-binding domain-containing protein [Nitrospirota bacterium]|nr:substrate-binding domain-containing protein [Nitrospirota bacterium]
MGIVLLISGLLLFGNADAALTGRILIAGYGPELPVIQDLAKAYERLHPGTAIDLEWESTVRAAHLVKTGEAQIAVTDQPDPALKATQIAWDGIAVIVNFSNPIKALSSAQISGIFAAQITNWSELDGAATNIEVIPRTAANNLTAGFKDSLGLTARIVASAAPVRSDQNVLRLVSGRDATISYISLATALKAQEDGISIQILTIDQVDPGDATVKNGRYRLRRPVLMLTGTQPDPLTESFLSFVHSVNGQELLRSMFVPLEPSDPTTTPSTVQQLDRSSPRS